MIKLWPTTPLDQLTPRPGATGQERNPFDLPLESSTSATGAAGLAWPTTPTSSYHPLLNTHPTLHLLHTNVNSANSDLTPLGTPTLSAFPAAQPTTQLSLHAPDFKMQQPPSRKSVNKKTSPSPSTTSSQSSNSSPQVTSSRGQIHVKLIQARSLNVRTTSARPYVVVQFEQNEFVSRDPTAETDKEVKGTATNVSRNSSSNAISALGAIGSKAAAALDLRKDKSSTNTSPASSLKSSGLANGLFGRLSAHNPVWKHEVSL